MQLEYISKTRIFFRTLKGKQMHLTLSVQALQVVGDGQPGEDGQTLVPHVEDGADRLCEGDVEGVQVL